MRTDWTRMSGMRMSGDESGREDGLAMRMTDGKDGRTVRMVMDEDEEW